jgi:hypothetical protein
MGCSEVCPELAVGAPIRRKRDRAAGLVDLFLGCTYSNEVLVRLVSGDLVEFLVKPRFKVNGSLGEEVVTEVLTATAGLSLPSDPGA